MTSGCGPIRSAQIGGVCAMVVVFLFASQAAAFDGAGPRLSDQTGPVLVEIDGWQVFANEVSGHGTYLRFDGVRASRGSGGPWMLVADRLLVGLGTTGLGAPGLTQVDWWLATGSVRLSGPDDTYVIARHLVTLEPARELVFTGDDEPASLVGADWQLVAAQIDVDLSRAQVSLGDL